MEQPKIIQIAIKKRIFIIPFNFQAHLIFKTINRVCRGFLLVLINLNLDIKFLFRPPLFIEFCIDPSTRGWILITATLNKGTFMQAETS